MKVTAVLIDTTSIQQYIFSSNKLKTNVGASHIVKSIYDKDHLICQLKKVGDGSDNWEQKSDAIQIISNNSLEWEIGYIGGGNALIFFKSKGKAINFIKEYTKDLLIKYPGLNTAFGIKEDFDINDFQNSIKNLHQSLRENKNKYFPRTTLEKFGFTLECKESSESAEFFYPKIGENVSSVFKVKYEMEEKVTKILNDKYKEILKGYEFPTEFKSISPEDEQSYIAVVHIDGNSMGKRFEECKNLIEIRNLSKTVAEATENAFKETLEILVKLISDKNLLEEKLGIKLKENKVPFRPIIIGGDDITFVSHGKLGIFLAKTFIKNFIKQKVSDNKLLSACAGIAIVKTGFPFFKAYQLSEELTKSAKDNSRKIENSSYIDFHISSGGFSGSWDDIKENFYQAIEGNAHFGPYRIDDDNDEKALKKLEEKIEKLSNKPKNKVLKLREVILNSKEEIEIFTNENNDFSDEKIWENKQTVHFDAIEAMEFYHPELIKLSNYGKN